VRCAAPLAAAFLCLATGATAQTPSTALDPFAPVPLTQTKPPNFEKLPSPSKPRSTLSSIVFAPPVSGAGKTGFDATNGRKKKPPRKPGQAPAPSGAQQQPVTDARPPASFAMAPATTPPLDIGAIRKPLKRKPRPDLDPYAQLGLRNGPFDIFPAVELIGGYSSNPGQVTDGRGAGLFSVQPELRVQSLWSRHEFKADLRGSYTWFSPDQMPSLNRPSFTGKADGRVDINESMHADLNAHTLVATDNPGSPNLQAGLAKLPVFATFGGGGGLTKSFNRLELTAKGDVERTVYQDSVLTDGTTASNQDRQYNQYSGGFRAAYETLPGVKPFVETDLDTRRHDLPIDNFGFQRDSKGLTVKGGSTFELRGSLTGELAVGYSQRDYDDPRFDKLAGLIGNASLVWTDALTTVKFTAASTIGESAVPGVPGVFYRDAGVQIDHAFRRWLIGTLKFGIGQDTYKGSNSDGTAPLCDCVQSDPGSNVADRIDNRYSVGAGLTYKVDRTVQIKNEFRQDWLRSNVAGVDYTASTFLVGLRLQR
jgi:hypothetical protein